MHAAEVFLRDDQPLRSGEAVHPARLGVIDGPALAALVHAAEVVLRVSTTLRGGEAVQPARLGVIDRRFDSEMVHVAEAGLRVSVTLRGGEAVQSARLVVIDRHPNSLDVALGKVRLNVWSEDLREFFERCDVIRRKLVRVPRHIVAALHLREFLQPLPYSQPALATIHDAEDRDHAACARASPRVGEPPLLQSGRSVLCAAEALQQEQAELVPRVGVATLCGLREQLPSGLVVALLHRMSAVAVALRPGLRALRRGHAVRSRAGPTASSAARKLGGRRDQLRSRGRRPGRGVGPRACGPVAPPRVCGVVGTPVALFANSAR